MTAASASFNPCYGVALLGGVLLLGLLKLALDGGVMGEQSVVAVFFGLALLDLPLRVDGFLGSSVGGVIGGTLQHHGLQRGGF
ncbi:hypothetical protein [Deinococcus psychrotolerans]|uniref:hypothetical protein n=1 Tax=Deinococcus psychrotolerans TaxID=2489213 RepID=UPI0013DE20A7|nr:hypothetical protein [Deinococcus psychrotolerans]